MLGVRVCAGYACVQVMRVRMLCARAQVVHVFVCAGCARAYTDLAQLLLDTVNILVT